MTKGTVNGEIYKSECLEKRLLPFLQQHDEAPLFWHHADLASCQYSKSVLEWYEANSVHFVPKDMNPPNCPELRLVEQYWAIMKRELRKSKKTVKDDKDMLRKWKKTEKLVPDDFDGGHQAKMRSILHSRLHRLTFLLIFEVNICINYPKILV